MKSNHEVKVWIMDEKISFALFEKASLFLAEFRITENPEVSKIMRETEVEKLQKKRYLVLWYVAHVGAANFLLVNPSYQPSHNSSNYQAHSQIEFLPANSNQFQIPSGSMRRRICYCNSRLATILMQL